VNHLVLIGEIVMKADRGGSREYGKAECGIAGLVAKHSSSPPPTSASRAIA